MRKIHALCLQLFAQDAGGDTAQDTGVTQAAAASGATGVTQAPDAGVQSISAEFEALITGKFKEEYDARVSQTVQKRLKDHKALASRLEALTPAVEAMAKRYGIDPADGPGLAKAVAEDASFSRVEEQAQAQTLLWQSQGEQTQKIYPAFDFGQALKDPRFVRLIQNDVPVQTAYEVLHRDEILPAAMAHTAFAVEQKLCNSLAAMASRPRESAMGSSHAPLAQPSVSQMSPQERAAIVRRVQKGEKIRL